MPNGGPTPDCYHCKWFAVDDRQCTKHNFPIKFVAIRIFCPDITIEDDPEWISDEVDLRTLQPQMLYIWLEIDYIDQQDNHHHKFNLYPLASMTQYKTWSDETVGDVFEKLHEAQRLLYQQRGYNVE